MQTETQLERDDPYNPNIASGTIPPKDGYGSGDGGGGCGCFLVILLSICAIGYIITTFMIERQQ